MIITLVFLLFDILSKAVVSRYIVLEKSIKLINKFLYITHVRNTGAAWSMFSSKTILVLIISLVIITGIILYIQQNKPTNKKEKLAYSMILGGALGNFINRLFLGYVIDFIDINIFNFPNFNIADICIVFGIFIPIALGVYFSIPSNLKNFS